MKNLLLLAALSVTAGAHALVTNGGFELNDYNGLGYKEYFAGDPGINGWTVTGTGSVDIVGTAYPVNSGVHALDLVGTPGPGEIEQTLATTNGMTYTVSFYAMHTGGSINAEVNVGLGATTQQFQVTTSYQLYSFNATAASAAEVLKLWSNPQNTSNGNTFIDDVSVEAVPEPATLAALGVGLAALRRRRK